MVGGRDVGWKKGYTNLLHNVTPVYIFEGIATGGWQKKGFIHVYCPARRRKGYCCKGNSTEIM
jgi:hypothetical protein